MMYVFTGSDERMVRKQAFLWIAAAKKKEPRLTYIRPSTDELDEATFELIIGSGALFVNRILVLIDDVYSSSYTEIRETLNKHLDELAHTNNAIVIIAPTRGNFNQKPLLKKATKVYVFDEKNKIVEKKGFNSALVNALGSKDPERLWLEVVRALQSDDAPEKIHGLLHWKARDLMIKGSHVWSPSQARALSLALLELLGNTRRAGLSLSSEMERFALSLSDNF